MLNLGAKAPGADSAPTSVSRAAQMAFSKVLSGEGAPYNILVNSLHVGIIVTDQIVRRHHREGANVSLEDFIAQAGRGVPLGRMGRAEEFANIACFLVSDAASYVPAARSMSMAAGRRSSNPPASGALRRGKWDWSARRSAMWSDGDGIGDCD